MNPTPSSPLPLGLSLGRFAAGCGLLALVCWPLDSLLIRALNPDTPGPVDGVLRVISQEVPRWTLTFAYVAGAAAMLLGRKKSLRLAGTITLLSPLACAIVINLMKRAAGRLRPLAPENGIEGLRPIMDLVDDRSFPSGHVATATVWALAVVLLLEPLRGRRLLLLLIPVMMWDRVALAVHHPSDVFAGAAIGSLLILGLQRVFAGRELEFGPRLRITIALFAVFSIGWVWQTPPEPVDPVSGEVLADLALKPRPLRLLLEPFVGPPLELAWVGEPRRLVPGGFLLGALVFMLLGLLPRTAPRRARFRNACLFVALASGWVLLVVHADLPADRFSTKRPGVFLDPHVHGSDPVDGARPVAFVLERIRRRGVHVIALTNHDAAPPSPEAIPGTEWSGFRHPTQTWLHILILGGDGAVAAALKQVEALAAVRAAKAAGGTVIVAHYWRTARVMRAEGHEPPTPAEFVAAGVDGFEVANRQPVTHPEDRARLEEIDRLCREHGLLRLASSDDHGKAPAGSPCISFVPGEFSDDPGLRRRDVLEHLQRGDPVLPVIFRRNDPSVRAPTLLAGPLAAWRYLRGMPLPGRLAWLAWWGVLALVLGGRRRGARE